MKNNLDVAIMFLLTDTCFWTHLKDLSENVDIDLKPILNKFRWGFTEEVQTELSRQKLFPFVPVDQAFIVPINEQELSRLRKKAPLIEEFDLADQTLIVSAERDNSIVLTDDGELFMQLLALNMKTLSLPLFCLALVKWDFIEKRVVSRALRYWEDTGRYASKDIKKWKTILQQIQ